MRAKLIVRTWLSASPISGAPMLFCAATARRARRRCTRRNRRHGRAPSRPWERTEKRCLEPGVPAARDDLLSPLGDFDRRGGTPFKCWSRRDRYSAVAASRSRSN